MNCPNCGSAIRDGAVFCPHCGATITSVANAPAQANAPVRPGAQHVQEPANASPQQTVQKPKRKHTGLKAVAAILAVLLAAGGGAFGMYQAVKAGLVPGVGVAAPQQAVAQTEAVSEHEAVSVLVSETETEPEPVVEVPEATSAYAPYLGEWEGEMYETDYIFYGHHNDYAAMNYPMKLNVLSIDDNGRLKADVSVMYHGYDSGTLTSDVDSHDGDQVITASDITTTFDTRNSSFEFRVDCGNPKNYLVVEVEAIETNNGAVQYECEVTSYFDDYRQYKDTYFLSHVG